MAYAPSVGMTGRALFDLANGIVFQELETETVFC